MLATPLPRRQFLMGFTAFLTANSLPMPGMTAGKTKRLRKWQCTNQDCDPYIFDPSIGDMNIIDEDNPIPPGVAFEDLPDDWLCHVCGDPKSHFIPLDQWVEMPA